MRTTTVRFEDTRQDFGMIYIIHHGDWSGEAEVNYDPPGGEGPTAKVWKGRAMDLIEGTPISFLESLPGLLHVRILLRAVSGARDESLRSKIISAVEDAT